jgi:ribonuclease P protein component
MRASSDFASVLRRGLKSGRTTVVVYLMRTPSRERMAGFAVSKSVGGAVVRNRVKRRLRAIVAEQLPSLPDGSAVVVRALPAAATATYAELAADTRGCLKHLARRSAA